MLHSRMSREKSPSQPPTPPAGTTGRRGARSGQGTSSLVAELNEETRVDQLVNRGRPQPANDDESTERPRNATRSHDGS
jgi:hypothetical protein